MELYSTNENEIRIHLSEKDLAQLEITVEEMDYENSKTRHVLWELFDRAKEETGFDAVSEKLYIQVFPKSDGGCDVIVSKMGEIRRKKQVLVFAGLENFSEAVRLLEPDGSMDFYKEKKENLFYINLPEEGLLPALLEYGEKAKNKSALFWKTRCRPILPEQIRKLKNGIRGKDRTF